MPLLPTFRPYPAYTGDDPRYPAYTGGTSPIKVVDATHFDIMYPAGPLIHALTLGASYSGTASARSSGGLQTYRWALGAFGPLNGFPAAVTYHQQRRVYASTASQPQTVWMSRIGGFNDFGSTIPTLDDDAVTFTLNAGQLNAIRSMLSLRKLLLLTTDSEWIVGSGNDSAITPAGIQADVQGYRGSSKLSPVGVGNVALYLQDKGQVVRDIGYEFTSDSYTGNDLTVMASHLVQGHRIVGWAFQENPFGILWMVRDDGILLGATYMREQQVIGWHRHDTDGLYESVCVIPEGNEDAIYVTVARTVDGTTKRFVERFETRVINDMREAFFVDCGLTFDGRSGYRGTAADTSAITMTVGLTGDPPWDETAILSLAASAPFFKYPATTDTGDEIVFELEDGNFLRFTILGTSSTTAATAKVNSQIPVAYRSAARLDWYVARNTLSGLDHLEGKTVSILGDGTVLPSQVVTDGVITIDPPAYIAHIGLPYTSDIATLPVVSSPSQGLAIGRRKEITGAVLIVEEASAISAGRDYDHLEDRKAIAPERYDNPILTEAGVVEMSFATPWQENGSFVIRNEKPLPVTILGLVPRVTVGD